LIKLPGTAGRPGSRVAGPISRETRHRHDQFEQEISKIRDSAATLPGWGSRTYDRTCDPYSSSPSWRGVTVSPGARSTNRTAKHLRQDDGSGCEAYIDVSCAFEAAQRASDLGSVQR